MTISKKNIHSFIIIKLLKITSHSNFFETFLSMGLGRCLLHLRKISVVSKKNVLTTRNKISNLDLSIVLINNNNLHARFVMVLNSVDIYR